MEIRELLSFTQIVTNVETTYSVNFPPQFLQVCSTPHSRPSVCTCVVCGYTGRPVGRIRVGVSFACVMANFLDASGPHTSTLPVAQFTTFFSDIIAFSLPLPPLACFGVDSHLSRLKFISFAPFLLCVMLVIGYIGRFAAQAALARLKAKRAARHARLEEVTAEHSVRVAAELDETAKGTRALKGGDVDVAPGGGLDTWLTPSSPGLSGLAAKNGKHVGGLGKHVGGLDEASLARHASHKPGGGGGVHETGWTRRSGKSLRFRERIRRNLQPLGEFLSGPLLKAAPPCLYTQSGATRSRRPNRFAYLDPNSHPAASLDADGCGPRPAPF